VELQTVFCIFTGTAWSSWPDRAKRTTRISWNGRSSRTKRREGGPRPTGPERSQGRSGKMRKEYEP